MTWNETKVGSDSKLVLHCGGRNVTWDELQKIPTPKPSGSHYPIPHHHFVEMVADGLAYHGYEVKTAAYAVAGDMGQRFFGVMSLFNRDNHMEWVLGIQGAHDKSSCRRGMLGTRVFVCDNMAFSGKAVFEFSRKHTMYIMRDLPMIVSRRLAGLSVAIHSENDRVERMRNSQLAGSVRVNDAIMRLYRGGAITATQISHVLREWSRSGVPGGHDGPCDPAMRELTPWRLLNCVTEINRENPIEDTPRRTQVANAICYQVALECSASEVVS
jgi:hypothetical protein